MSYAWYTKFFTNTQWFFYYIMREFYEQWGAVFSNRPLSMGDLALTQIGDADYTRQMGVAT